MTHLDPRGIVAAMGGKVTGRNTCSVPGPGHSKRDLSLSIRTGSQFPGGFVVSSFAGGSNGYGDGDQLALKDYVRQRLGLEEWRVGEKPRPLTPAEKQNIAAAQAREKEKRKKFPLKIWSESLDPRGTMAERYLREHRGIDLDDDVAGAVIRFNPSLKFGEIYCPALVALFRDIVTDEPCGIHRVFLDQNTAQKLDRWMLGPTDGCAIKFDDHSDTVVIGEGIETVLAARTLGLRPAWALGASGAVGRFPVVSGISRLQILEEADPTSRGDVAACARRYLGARKGISIHRPDTGRKDMNDVLRAMQ